MSGSESPAPKSRWARKVAAREAAKSRRRGKAQMAGVGIELAVGIVGGVMVGNAIDQWLGTQPWFMMVLVFGALFGAVARLVILSSRVSKARAGVEEETPDG